MHTLYCVQPNYNLKENQDIYICHNFWGEIVQTLDKDKTF